MTMWRPDGDPSRAGHPLGARYFIPTALIAAAGLAAALTGVVGPIFAILSMTPLLGGLQVVGVRRRQRRQALLSVLRRGGQAAIEEVEEMICRLGAVMDALALERALDQDARLTWASDTSLADATGRIECCRASLSAGDVSVAARGLSGLAAMVLSAWSLDSPASRELVECAKELAGLDRAVAPGPVPPPAEPAGADQPAPLVSVLLQLLIGLTITTGVGLIDAEGWVSYPLGAVTAIVLWVVLSAFRLEQRLDRAYSVPPRRYAVAGLVGVALGGLVVALAGRELWPVGGFRRRSFDAVRRRGTATAPPTSRRHGPQRGAVVPLSVVLQPGRRLGVVACR